MSLIQVLTDIGEAGLFGVIQGATEFLPISSSGHLLLLHNIIGDNTVNAQAFDVALHVGTLAALFWFFWADIWVYAAAAWAWIRRPTRAASPDQRLAGYILLSAVPGAIIGAQFETFFATAVRSPVVVGVTLMTAGILLWAADRFRRQLYDLQHLNWRRALFIGLAQAVALIPGVSRSGATISMGRLLGLDRPSAARFSFLMAVPIIAGAALKEGLDLGQVGVTSGELLDMAVGVIVAAIVGYLAIRGLLRYVSQRSYAVFAVYRLALGVVVFATLWWRS